MSYPDEYDNPANLLRELNTRADSAQDVEKWKKKYYDVADAITRESTGVEDLCRQATDMRAELQRLREAAKEFIAEWYNHFPSGEDEAMSKLEASLGKEGAV